jgi:hypothetical protein
MQRYRQLFTLHVISEIAACFAVFAWCLYRSSLPETYCNQRASFGTVLCVSREWYRPVLITSAVVSISIDCVRSGIERCLHVPVTICPMKIELCTDRSHVTASAVSLYERYVALRGVLFICVLVTVQF